MFLTLSLSKGEGPLDRPGPAAPAGAPDALIEDLDLGLVSCSGSLAARLRDDTLLGDGGAAPIELVWRWSRSVTESVVFTAGRVFLPKTKHAVSGPAAIEATYSWQAAKDGGGTGATLQVVVTNDVTSS